MPLFRIYEVFPDGSLHDTDKVIMLNTYGEQHGSSSYDIVNSLFQIYGFTQYANYYHAKTNNSISKDIHIRYNYADGGLKSTWVLKEEETETKENENE
jgi:hypothetical protein